ncbi:ABC-type transport auxiliary lipoprotein family protein [Chelativorans sp. SCAU2101]|jgi:ABC-type uncharacterized transport system, auxiliary component|uniref:ABC-type transport auxiliary lipoprotein family protein n=1 Tax=Chelativorans petroleitrophicus TaxID=2975484 RepID=A0A9X2X982_9HYPH|nr:ABC-type transport auxiliary lipoprotein family protein [Chelativorans petroleitrophicus]MCT8991063.1 ABC-type transport auxiliary lipoprotein family protein [Chelativorans petroleitrophicus]
MAVKTARYGVAVLALLLSGCAAIPGFGPRPVDAYDLRVPPPSSQGPRISRAQLLVPEPAAIALFDGENIAIRRADGALQVLRGARWSDRLPRLVQDELVKAYQQSGRVGGVGRPGEGLAIDYQIIVDIRAFEVRVGSGSDHAHVELFVRILDDRNGTVRASRGFAASVPITGEGSQALVAALDQAFGLVTNQIVDWSLGVI